MILIHVEQGNLDKLFFTYQLLRYLSMLMDEDASEWQLELLSSALETKGKKNGLS